MDTSEITKRHTSKNLHEHIKKVMNEWGIQTSGADITINHNEIPADDIDEGIDYMRDDNEDETEQEYESQTEFSQTQLSDEDETQISQEDVESCSNIHKTVVFTSDNAADITKALRDEGNYIWIGCAAHHINLIIKEGFKKVAAAAQLLKNCKAIVLAVNHSQPLLYDVRNNQNELGIPQQALMQEMITRWWSILSMLESIYKTHNTVALSLLKFDKKHLVLTSDSLC